MTVEWISAIIYFISIMFLIIGLLLVRKADFRMIGLGVYASDDPDEDMKLPHIRHLIQSNRWLIASAVLAGLANLLSSWSICDG